MAVMNYISTNFQLDSSNLLHIYTDKHRNLQTLLNILLSQFSVSYLCYSYRQWFVFESPCSDTSSCGDQNSNWM